MSAKCGTCGHAMTKGRSCIKLPVEIKNKEAEGVVLVDPVPYGSETHHSLFLQSKYEHPTETDEQVKKRVDDFQKMHGIGPYRPKDSVCPDCNVRVGGYHHPGCDQEECPSCHRQLLSCDCHAI